MPHHGKFRLSAMDLDFVSLVPRGDDPMARVVLSKAEPTSQQVLDPPRPLDNLSVDERNSGACKHEGCEQKAADGSAYCSEHRGVHKSAEDRTRSSTLSRNDPLEDGMGEKITKDDLPDEVVAYIDGLETEVDTLSAQVEKSEKDLQERDALLQEKDDQIAKMIPKDEESEGEISKALLEKADPAVRSLIEKQEQAIREAQQIAKAERDERLNREYVAKAETMPMISEDKAELGKLLRRLSEVLTPEENEAVNKMFRAANEQIAKGSLFDTLGSGGAPTTISKSVEAAAAEVKKAHPDWTDAQCEAEVYTRQPELFREAMTAKED